MVSILEIIKKGLVVASSDNNEKIELAIPARSDLSDQEIYDLLIKSDEGPFIKNEEYRILSSVKSIRWKGISKLPKNMRLLISLLKLDLSGAEINDISALSNLRNLEILYLNNTNISDISALSNLT